MTGPRIASLLVSDLVILSHSMRPDEKAQWCAVTGAAEYDADAAARMLAGLTGISYCLVGADGTPQVAAGFEQVRPKVWQAWMAGTLDAWRDHWKLLTRECKRRGDELLASGAANRLQILAMPEREAAHRWYEALGYHFEVQHARYFADGSDAVCYVRTV